MVSIEIKDPSDALMVLTLLSFLLGFFLILAGFGILNLEKVKVTPGRATIGFGVGFIAIGTIFLLVDYNLPPRSSMQISTPVVGQLATTSEATVTNSVFINTTIAPSTEVGPDVYQIQNLIAAEVKGAIEQDLVLLESLYVPDAVIIDYRSTPDDFNNVRVYRGWESIEQQHYLRFFSGNHKSMYIVDLAVTVNGNTARVTHRGVVVDGEYREDMGIFTLEKVDDGWMITQLEYRLK